MEQNKMSKNVSVCIVLIGALSLLFLTSITAFLEMYLNLHRFGNLFVVLDKLYYVAVFFLVACLAPKNRILHVFLTYLLLLSIVVLIYVFTSTPDDSPALLYLFSWGTLCTALTMPVALILWRITNLKRPANR